MEEEREGQRVGRTEKECRKNEICDKKGQRENKIERVCVCVKEREREREKERDGERERCRER